MFRTVALELGAQVRGIEPTAAGVHALVPERAAQTP
jgi:hypothetical protein